jgi:hypothetical protein
MRRNRRPTGREVRHRSALVLLLGFVATSAPPNLAGARTCEVPLDLVDPTISVIDGMGDPEAEVERWRGKAELNTVDPIGFYVSPSTEPDQDIIMIFKFEPES